MREKSSCEYRILYLGPKNTYSHTAAKKARKHVISILKTRGEADLEPSDIALIPETHPRSILDALDLSEHSFAVVPISNSRVGDVFDFMPFYAYQMVAEVEQEIDLWLCNKTGKLEDISIIVTKNTAYEQVKRELDCIRPALPFQPTSSTAEAASLAAKDAKKGAVCAKVAATAKRLKPVCEKLAVNVTTFGIFRNEPKPVHIPREAEVAFNALLRGAGLYSGRCVGGGPQEFAQALAGDKRLKVKWGIDPLRPSLHLGHLANIRRLGTFIDLGHAVTVVLGTFTGKIGDPSGNLEQRERLDHAELQENAKSIKQQIRAILGDKVEFIENHDMCNDLTVDRLLQWGYKIDVRLLTDRRDFIQRRDSDMPLHLSELLYGLFQAFDSVVLGVDVEVGGMDQLWNCVLMRDIMSMEQEKAAFALLIHLLPGIDGSEKMSSFLGNDIQLCEPRDLIKEKLLKIRSAKHLFSYMRLLTNIGESCIAAWELGLSSGATTIDELSKRMTEEVLNSIPKLPK